MPASGYIKTLRSKRLRRFGQAVWVVALASFGGCASAPANGDEAGMERASADASRSAPDSLTTDSLGVTTVGSDSATAATAANVRPGIGLRQPAGGLTGDQSAGPIPTAVEAPEIPREIPVSFAYPGFLPSTLATEPLAVLPPVRITIPPEIAGGPEGGLLTEDLRRIVLDRLPAEIRIVRPRAPAYAFREWAQGRDVGPESAYLPAILGWEGAPGPDGAIPEVVGNSVEALGDNRGIRYFLFPRSLEIFRSGRLRYVAVLEAYLLDARGERAVWAGSGRAEGTLPENDPSQFLRGVIRDAATAAVNDLAARLPGADKASGRGGFTQ